MLDETTKCNGKQSEMLMEVYETSVKEQQTLRQSNKQLQHEIIHVKTVNSTLQQELSTLRQCNEQLQDEITQAKTVNITQQLELTKKGK